MINTTRKEVRQLFKAIGYSVSFPHNSLNDSICNLAFKNTGMLKPVVVSPSNCYSSDFRESHKQAFELANSFNYHYLVDTDQKIV
jgi:hypothetical protein